MSKPEFFVKGIIPSRYQDGNVPVWSQQHRAFIPQALAYAATTHTHAVGDLTQSGATANQVLTWNGSAWAPATASAGAITNSEGLCTADVTITSANTWYLATGATFNLTAGTWLLLANILFGRVGTGAVTYTARIRNITDNITIAEQQSYHPSVNPHYTGVTLTGRHVIASGTKTIELQGADNVGTNGRIKANPTINSTGTNVTTMIYAIKLA